MVRVYNNEEKKRLDDGCGPLRLGQVGTILQKIQKAINKNEKISLDYDNATGILKILVNGVEKANINLGLEKYVNQAEIVVNPNGLAEGKYIKLTFEGGADPVFIPTEDIGKIYFPGEGIYISSEGVISCTIDPTEFQTCTDIEFEENGDIFTSCTPSPSTSAIEGATLNEKNVDVENNILKLENIAIKGEIKNEDISNDADINLSKIEGLSNFLLTNSVATENNNVLMEIVSQGDNNKNIIIETGSVNSNNYNWNKSVNMTSDVMPPSGSYYIGTATYGGGVSFTGNYANTPAIFVSGESPNCLMSISISNINISTKKADVTVRLLPFGTNSTAQNNNLNPPTNLKFVIIGKSSI